MRLTQADASFVYAESASGPMHISSIYILEGELTYERVLERFRARLHLIPAYRRKLAPVPLSIAHPEWVDDTDFDLTRHVLQHRVPAGSTLEDGVAAAVAQNEPMLDRSRPLWKMVVIEGVPGKTLLLQATHHAMIDGASGIELTTILYDLDPKPPRTGAATLAAARAARRSRAIQSGAARQLRGVARNQSAEAVQGRREADGAHGQGDRDLSRFAMRPAILAPFNAGFVGPHRHVALDEEGLGGHPRNPPDARRHHQRRGARGRVRSRRALPRGARRADGESASPDHVPGERAHRGPEGRARQPGVRDFPDVAGMADGGHRATRRSDPEMQRIKEEEEAQALTLFRESMPSVPPVGLCSPSWSARRSTPPRSPRACRCRCCRARGGAGRRTSGINFVCTNVPGVQVPQYMCGHEVTDTMGLLVLTGNMGFSITILSYNRRYIFSFICEPRLLPDLRADHRMRGGGVFGELLSIATARNEAAQAQT